MRGETSFEADRQSPIDEASREQNVFPHWPEVGFLVAINAKQS
jgi:hypothetical protein